MLLPIVSLQEQKLLQQETVQVSVNTPRSAEQERALSSVNSLIDGVVEKMQEDMQAGKDVGSVFETCRRYLNACNPDQPDGPIDQRFQAQVVGCHFSLFAECLLSRAPLNRKNDDRTVNLETFLCIVAEPF
ncbi:unnamed protein product [Strongylus vulgaris]|uniref:Uncharacterized protein n=1 Tax=Strongylus vulgaris TaxID=40348 RepID=A0A3P7JGQ1_STRVU|nr:unnamed protein product [Strongylus vulgaris]